MLPGRAISCAACNARHRPWPSHRARPCSRSPPDAVQPPGRRAAVPCSIRRDPARDCRSSDDKWTMMLALSCCCTASMGMGQQEEHVGADLSGRTRCVVHVEWGPVVQLSRNVTRRPARVHVEGYWLVVVCASLICRPASRRSELPELREREETAHAAWLAVRRWSGRPCNTHAYVRPNRRAR